jgi:hypothetical protein
VPDRYGVVRFEGDLRVVELSLAGKLLGPMDVPHVVTDLAGNLVRNELTRSDWFFTLDAALAKRWNFQRHGQLTASAGVQNLFAPAPYSPSPKMTVRAGCRASAAFAGSRMLSNWPWPR